MGLSLVRLPDEGAPQVGITVTGLDAATPSTISVHVSTDDGVTWTAVRGADHLVVVGATFLRDFVPPLNTPATYRLTVHVGSTPTPAQATITVTSGTAWVHSGFQIRASRIASGVAKG